MGLRRGGQADGAARRSRFYHGRLARTSSTLSGAGRFLLTGWFTGSLVACDAPHPIKNNAFRDRPASRHFSLPQLRKRAPGTGCH